MKKPHLPAPEDTSGVLLPDSLRELSEKIAENVHNVWAEGRVSEGWVYGKTENPARKTTPKMVPYADLPEAEKDYDRRTATETLKLIVKLGYRILPPAGDGEEKTDI